MRAIFVCAVLAGMFAVFGTGLAAQEVVATPSPSGGVVIGAGAASQLNPVADKTMTATGKDGWRYRWFNDRWWYWTPQNRWMWYSDDGHWVEFDPNHPPVAVVPRVETPLGYGYYPGVVVGVGPYGNVGVGVGRRLGVDVWGPHGEVRVGRRWIGW